MRSLLLALLCTLSITPTFAQPASPRPVTGNLTIDGKPIPLRYAYAIQVEDVEAEGLVLSGPTKYQVLVFSDRPLPAACVANRNAPLGDLWSMGQLMEPLQKGGASQMYGLRFKYDPEKQALLEAELYYPGKEVGFSIGGMEIPDKLTGVKVERGVMSGGAVLAGPRSTGRQKSPKKYQYRLTFRVPLRSEAAVTAKWEGKEAMQSPPVQAIREYLGAAKQGEIATLKRLTAASHQGYLAKAEVLKWLREGDVSKMEEQIRRVVVRGDRATVMLVNEQPNYSQVGMHLVREGGSWKLCWP